MVAISDHLFLLWGSQMPNDTMSGLDLAKIRILKPGVNLEDELANLIRDWLKIPGDLRTRHTNSLNEFGFSK